MNIRLKQIARTIARAIWEDYLSRNLATFVGDEINDVVLGALGARGNA